jgi:hypothetical protein
MLAHLVYALEIIFLLNTVLRVVILLLQHAPGTVRFDPIKPISNLKLAPSKRENYVTLKICLATPHLSILIRQEWP